MRSRTPMLVPAWFIAALVIAPGIPGFLGFSASPGWLTQSAYGQEVPFTGVVNQNQTDVRAGAADRYYRVGELDKGQLVRVDEVIVGWYKITPPKGVYSFISKAFVDAKGDGSVGVVNTDRSKAYAADINGPAGSYRVQAILNEGDGVQIVGEEGSHYRIVAPSNAYVYLPPGSVRRALAMEIEAAEEPVEAEPEPAPEPQREPEPVVETAPQPVVAVPVVPVEPEPVVVEAPVVEVPVEQAPEPVAEPEAAVEVEPESEEASVEALEDMLDEPEAAQAEPVVVEVKSLSELEAEFESVQELPLEDRPLGELIAQYEALQAAGGLTQNQTYRVASRLASLRHDFEIVQGLNAIAEAREPLAQAETQPADAVSYDAVGRLLASSVYDGKTLPRMYRLADPATGRAVAYIRPGGPVDTTSHLGRLVGVQGEQAYDPALKLKVLTVKRIDTLQAAD
jgi:outer membrane biosynthesis protein TonB